MNQEKLQGKVPAHMGALLPPTVCRAGAFLQHVGALLPPKNIKNVNICQDERKCSRNKMFRAYFAISKRKVTLERSVLIFFLCLPATADEKKV